MLKIIPYKDSASSIWTHLKNKYSRPLDFKYIWAHNECISLCKDNTITIDAHITCFNQLFQEVEYYKSFIIYVLEEKSINPQFIVFLGKGKSEKPSYWSKVSRFVKPLPLNFTLKFKPWMLECLNSLHSLKRLNYLWIQLNCSPPISEVLQMDIMIIMRALIGIKAIRILNSIVIIMVTAEAVIVAIVAKQWEMKSLLSLSRLTN